MMLTILIVTGLGIVASIIYYRSWEFLPFLYGAIIGGTVSLIKVYLLERTVNKVMTMEGQQATNYATLQNLLRLGLTALGLLAGALIPGVNLWGAILGVIAYQPAVYSIRNVTNE